MITCIVQATLCWAAFYALYAGLLSRATFFSHNRAYLVGSLLLGLALPLLDWQQLLPAGQPEALVVAFQPITIGMENLEVVVSATAAEPGLGWWEVLLATYWLGVGVAGLRFAHGLHRLWRLYQSSERRKQDGYTLVVTEEWHAPFSFFNTLFWSLQMPYPPEDEKKIIRHERAHMRGWHSLDIMLVEVLGIVFWLSPMVYLYSRSLRVVHEYLADAAVLQTTGKKKQYGHLLLSQSQSGQPIALANHFINSQLKKRILMMTKTRSKRHILTRYLLALPLLFVLALALAGPNNVDGVLPAALAPDEEPTKALLPGDVDRMPVFAGCEAMETEESQAECTKEKLVEFMIGNLKYPEEAKKANAEGLVVVQFTVAKDGSVQDAKVMKSVGHGCDEAALAVVNAMPNWTPAMKDGEPVAMQMSLPFSFKLPQGQAQVGRENEEVFKVVEEMPRFPGCDEDGVAEGELVQCSNMKLIEYIANNIKYPRDAKDAGVEGVAVVSFVVDKEGWVKDIKVVRPLQESIDSEVVRVVKQMNEMEERWIPGRQKGRVVNVQFNLPVKFRLDAERKQLQIPEGAGELKLQNFKASPNPTTSVLNLRFEAEALPTAIRLLNASGQEVYRETLNRFEGAYNQAIGLGNLPKGAYVLHISQGERIFAEKIILK
ncbi:MAG: TonB family protein [Lewinellaceae bacterium]|nr:TonB family protein [Lewinellaceae bacterium]